MAASTSGGAGVGPGVIRYRFSATPPRVLPGAVVWASGQGAARVDGGAAEANLEVEVRAVRVARGTDEAEALAGLDSAAAVDVDCREVRVERADAVAVEDDDQLAPPAARESGERDAAGRCRLHGRAGGRNQVDACVEAVAARAEGVAQSGL